MALRAAFSIAPKIHHISMLIGLPCFDFIGAKADDLRQKSIAFMPSLFLSLAGRQSLFFLAVRCARPFMGASNGSDPGSWAGLGWAVAPGSEEGIKSV